MNDRLPYFFDELTKIARADPQAVLRPYVKGVAGMTVGSGVGWLGMAAADKAHRSATGKGLPRGLKAAIPIVGAVSGFISAALQDKMFSRAKKELNKGMSYGGQNSRD